MNTLFVDIENFKDIASKYNAKRRELKENPEKKLKLSEQEKIDFVSKVTGIKLKSDILSNGYTSNNVNLSIDCNLFFKLKNSKSKVKQAYLNNMLRMKLKNMDKINIVFSKCLDDKSCKEQKDYIINKLNNIKHIQIKEIKISNKMLVNDIRYINDYVERAKINKNKLKILIAINDIKDFSTPKLIEYISNYKFVDILRMNGINKIEYNKLSSKINEINEEYGTTIEIIQKRNIQDYNVCLMYSNIDKNEFTSHYILGKNSKYLDINNEEEDIYNENNRVFERNKYDIETLFKRIQVNMNHFSKNKIGALLLEEKNIT